MAKRRAAFDIGSGATKVMIADVDGTMVNQLYGVEIPVSFAADWKQSADGTLSEAIQSKGLETLRNFLAECDKQEVPADARRAIATEVFRKAQNGASYLDRVRSELNLPVKILTQEEEAEVGFKTAVALHDGPPDSVICWDSGGASFQITSRNLDGSLQSYLGALGTGVVWSMLQHEIQGDRAGQTPNPVKKEDAEKLLEKLKNSVPEGSSWLADSKVTAIGGQNSMFCVAAEALDTYTYTQDDVRKAMFDAVGCTDDQLSQRKYGQGENREIPAYIVPKLCLLLAVMEHCKITQVSYFRAIGSCPGMLITNELYT